MYVEKNYIRNNIEIIELLSPLNGHSLVISSSKNMFHLHTVHITAPDTVKSSQQKMIHLNCT